MLSTKSSDAHENPTVMFQDDLDAMLHSSGAMNADELEANDPFVSHRPVCLPGVTTSPTTIDGGPSSFELPSLSTIVKDDLLLDSSNHCLNLCLPKEVPEVRRNNVALVTPSLNLTRGGQMNGGAAENQSPFIKSKSSDPFARSRYQEIRESGWNNADLNQWNNANLHQERFNQGHHCFRSDTLQTSASNGPCPVSNQGSRTFEEGHQRNHLMVKRSAYNPPNYSFDGGSRTFAHPRCSEARPDHRRQTFEDSRKSAPSGTTYSDHHPHAYNQNFEYFESSGPTYVSSSASEVQFENRPRAYNQNFEYSESSGPTYTSSSPSEVQSNHRSRAYNQNFEYSESNGPTYSSSSALIHRYREDQTEEDLEFPPTAKFLSSYFLSNQEHQGPSESIKEEDFFLRDDISRRYGLPFSMSQSRVTNFALPEGNVSPRTLEPPRWASNNYVTPAFTENALHNPSKKYFEKKLACKENVQVLNNAPTRKNLINQGGSHSKGVLIKSLLKPSHENLVTRFNYAVMCQLEVTEFQKEDRRGNRSTIPLSFKGVMCRHCQGKTSRTGRYFPSSIKSFSDSEKILFAVYRHLGTCIKCPASLKVELNRLFDSHRMELKDKSKRHGCQRAFYRQIWNQIHPTQPKISKRK